MSRLKITVIGGGLGGLCLAQMLRRSNIEVAIFERDASPSDRPQGYRLHLDKDGVGALRDALPEDLLSLFEATAMRPAPFTTIVDTSLKELRRVPSGGHASSLAQSRGHWLAECAPVHVNVNRATLREILLTGLDDVIRFGARFVRYEQDEEGVTAIFDDGSAVRSDVLIGADGIRSAVRAQRLPEARTMDTGVRAIYARIPMETAREILPKRVLADVFTAASDPRKVFLGLGPVVFPSAPGLASARLASQACLSPERDYMVCIVGGRREHFGIEDAALRRASGAELQQVAVRMLRDWPEAAAIMPAQADPASFFAIEMHSSIPCTLDTASRVTLLGDSIHAMTPTLGRGANIAMRDAALLGHSLIAADLDEVDLSLALNAYERGMAKYGFDAVRESTALGQRLMGQDPLPE
ncbi:monooxygenase FAD-binding protein [Rhizobium sp. CF080]|uniref:FAD-dependent oxidoreductase n=1 Tax=Rhizobium sp. (strain CF080) TaxID=1144310 RepID=UPI000271B4A9|nr:NAD(P)/FAD-dependent oxidoreductase [Rhizobium sp. CF080]EUB96759.1 monooxygenase FAD-binding protein [Rhizobium sp. CF080]